MAKYNGPKNRLSRREGVDLFGKGIKLRRANIAPGVHGPKGERKSPSQYGQQLREKQKVKRMYGILEKQFRIYVAKALESEGNTGEALLVLLEKRLDNVVYRLGFAKTRQMARQLVSHRHVLVNGKKVNIASYQLRVGDAVSLADKISNNTNLKVLISDKDYVVPAWLERKAIAGKIVRNPNRLDVVEPISEQDIVEFYSR